MFLTSPFIDPLSKNLANNSRRINKAVSPSFWHQ
jgi:hypothetical protein